MNANPEPEREDEPAARLAEIFVEHHDFVWRCARRLGAPPEAVDDVVQEVFVVVSRRLDAFEGRAAIRTWLFGIAMRVVRSMRRQQWRHRRRVEVAAELRVRPADEAERHQRLDLLDRLLGELDETRRAVFILAELEGMSAPEIADALGVKPNTVYSRLRLAREQLQRAVKRHRARDRGEGS